MKVQKQTGSTAQEDTKMTDKKHGVVVTGARMQPFAVWVDGEVVLFTASREEADHKLWAEEKRMGAKR